MKNSINKLLEAIKNILKDNILSFYIYGSTLMNDYKHGWSDIDIICFTKHDILDTQAEELKMLRQTLRDKEPKNKYFRKFEGIFVPFNNFQNNDILKVVYWGTSGQKIKDDYKMDPFSKYQIINNSKLIFGTDVLNQLLPPTKAEFIDAIKYHYNSIREHAQTTDTSLYSCGWLLDIARCLYTLKYNSVISKTDAGKWALKNNLCPEPDQMKKALKVRKKPLKYKNNEKTKQWLSSLGPSVQLFANVLEQELGKTL